MITARTNQALAFSRDGNILYNIAGLLMLDSESMNFVTGKQRLFARSPSLLDKVNHNAVYMVSDEELWITNYCQGENNQIDNLVQPAMIKLNLADGTEAVGAKLRAPRCAAFQVVIPQYRVKKAALVAVQPGEAQPTISQHGDSWKEDLVCLVGGAVYLFRFTMLNLANSQACVGQIARF